MIIWILWIVPPSVKSFNCSERYNNEQCAEATCNKKCPVGSGMAMQKAFQKIIKNYCIYLSTSNMHNILKHWFRFYFRFGIVTSSELFAASQND